MARTSQGLPPLSASLLACGSSADTARLLSRAGLYAANEPDRGENPRVMAWSSGGSTWPATTASCRESCGRQPKRTVRGRSSWAAAAATSGCRTCSRWPGAWCATRATRAIDAGPGTDAVGAAPAAKGSETAPVRRRRFIEQVAAASDQMTADGRRQPCMTSALPRWARARSPTGACRWARCSAAVRRGHSRRALRGARAHGERLRPATRGRRPRHLPDPVPRPDRRRALLRACRCSNLIAAKEQG